MNIKGQVTSFAGRVEIGERWKAGQKDREIALAAQRPLATIWKWRRQYSMKDGMALPWSPQAWRENVLCQEPNDTTL